MITITNHKERINICQLSTDEIIMNNDEFNLLTSSMDQIVLKVGERTITKDVMKWIKDNINGIYYSDWNLEDMAGFRHLEYVIISINDLEKDFKTIKSNLNILRINKLWITGNVSELPKILHKFSGFTLNISVSEDFDLVHYTKNGVPENVYVNIRKDVRRTGNESIFEVLPYSEIMSISTSIGYTFDWNNIPDFKCHKMTHVGIYNVPYNYDKDELKDILAYFPNCKILSLTTVISPEILL
jgi:hypothetical protein